MSKRAQLADGTILEFPDDTPDSVVDLAVKRHMAESQKSAKPNASNSDFAAMVSGKKRQPQPNALGFDNRAQGEAYGMGPAYAGLDYLDAARHHVASLGMGIGQFIHKGVTAAADAMLPADNSLRQGIDRIDAKAPRVLAQREADYQARVPNSAAATAGAATGEILPWMTGIGELRAAGILPQVAKGEGFAGKLIEYGKKGGLLALEGGAYGATQPVTGEGSYARQKGAQVGVGAAAAPVMGSMVGGTVGLARLSRYLTPAGREAIAGERLGRLYGTDQGTLDLLRRDSGVPGFELTPAQALSTPEAVQAERALRNNPSTAPAFAGREAQNNAAARGQVAKVAGTEADLEAARAARRDGPGAFWRDNLPRGAEENRFKRAQDHLAGFLKSKTMPMPEFKILNEARKIAGQVQRGSISMEEGDAAIRALSPTTKGGKKALEQALGLIDGGMVNPNRIVNELQRLAKDPNTTVSGAANDALAAIGKNQDGMGYIHARVLDGVRQNIGTMLAKNAPAMRGAGSAEGAAYGPLKAKITNAIDRAVPGYRNNLAAYASASQPINDMEAARTLLNAIDSGGRDSLGGQAVNLTQVRALLSKDNRANFPMSESARREIEAVLEALQQRSVSNNTIAASGPGTAADLTRGLSPAAARWLGHAASILGGVKLGPLGYLAGAGATEAATAANNSVLKILGPKAASARETASALEILRQRKISPPGPNILDSLLPYQQRALPAPRR